MKAILCTLVLSLSAAVSGYAQEVPDSLNYTLETSVIKAERIIHKGDHHVMYPSEANKSFGTNALDAVSSLDMFQSALNETVLTSWDRKAVYILINGVPSTAYDLRGYKGQDIKKVEYYPVAPAQYMSLTEGPVVNVIVKKRHDVQYTGYFNLLNGVNTGFGENQADLTYSDSLNQVKLDYLYSYRNYGRLGRQAEYTYGSQLHTQYDGPSRYKGALHNIGASYQRFQGKHLFNARLYTRLMPLQDIETRTGVITAPDGTYQGSGINAMKTSSNTLAADLYYSYNMDNGGLFAINVVNTFGNSFSDSERSMKFDGSEAAGYDYDIRSRVDNDSYSLIGNALYTAPLWGGRISASSRYEYRQLDQVSSGNEYRPYSHTGSLNAGGAWFNNGMSFVPTAGVKIVKQESAGVSQTSASPYLRLYCDWWGKGKADGLTVQMTLLLRNTVPSLDKLTESTTYLDPWLISIGNPHLKSSLIYSGDLVLGWFPTSSRNQLFVKLSPSYASDKIATTVVKEGENIYLKPQNIGGDFEFMLYAYGSLYPFKWLELSPYVEYYRSRFDTPAQKVKFDYWRVGGNITASVRNVEMIVAINSPTKEYDGDLLSRGSLQYAGVVQYKIGDWSVGVRCNYRGHNDYTAAELPAFRFYERQDWRPYHLVQLTATYTFSVGRSRRHASKMINESGTDNTGLNRFNTIEMK